MQRGEDAEEKPKQNMKRKTYDTEKLKGGERK
jgi:hypothetical protein